VEYLVLTANGLFALRPVLGWSGRVVFVQQMENHIHRDGKIVQSGGAFFARQAGSKQVRGHAEQLLDL